jgi:beta-N-acetylhexosaminidase
LFKINKDHVLIWGRGKGQANKMEIRKTDYRYMAGQRLMLGFNGTQFNDELRHIIEDIKACGIILFKRNIQNPEQVKSLCRDCQAHAQSCGIPPLFIAIDQEGGIVSRLEPPFTQFKGNPFIKSVQAAKNFAAITAGELKNAGINMNLAPVLDVVPDKTDSIMKKRAFSGGPEIVSEFGMQMIRTFQENGIMAVAKHFPGIGRTVKDSHFFLPVLDTDFAELENFDLIPFQAAIDHDVSGIMLSHILYTGLDRKWQASLSRNIAHGLLRGHMGYDGLVMTDDLDMKAVEHDMKTCIYRVMAAGIDIALICHKGPDIDIAFSEAARLLAEDSELHALGIESCERIMRIKNIYLKIDFCP